MSKNMHDRYPEKLNQKTKDKLIEIEKDKVKILQVKNVLEDLQKRQKVFEENKYVISRNQNVITRVV